MSQVKLELAKMSLPEKVQLGKVLAMTLEIQGATFTDPPYPEGDFLDLCTDAEAAYNAAQAMRQQAKSLTSAQDDAEALLDKAFTQTANYVQNVSGGDASIIALSGLGVKASPTPSRLLAAPANVVATAGNGAGQIILTWRAVRGASNYMVELTASLHVPVSWNHVAATTKTKATVNGLISASRYWFRIAAVNPAGLGTWSEPVDRVAG